MRRRGPCPSATNTRPLCHDRRRHQQPPRPLSSAHWLVLWQPGSKPSSPLVPLPGGVAHTTAPTAKVRQAGRRAIPEFGASDDPPKRIVPLSATPILVRYIPTLQSHKLPLLVNHGCAHVDVIRGVLPPPSRLADLLEACPIPSVQPSSAIPVHKPHCTALVSPTHTRGVMTTPASPISL